ncbi:choline transporter-like protein 5-B isoform X3 [Ictalurus punctatus]|uniref:Choline transporter-like protein n=1 Tax=Ictalurus punctatus TaxID=7998 RepID=A0A979EV63_ICTPU|nr:choline transporter-like protein 5-B isoform X3 [Ictalurus punctatus]
MGRKTPLSPSYCGEPHKFDPKFRGPVRNRCCTDTLCCVFFVIIILSYIALGTVAWMHGDPRKVIYPTDSYGQFCGQQDTANENKAVLFYFNILQCANPAVLINLQCPTTQLCVSECPDRFITYVDVQYSYSRNRSQWDYYRQFCRPGFNTPTKSVVQVIRDEDCPSMLVPSRPFLQRCFPDFITRNGTLTVANKTIFKDGLGKSRSVSELRDAANRFRNSVSFKLGVNGGGVLSLSGISSLLDAKEIGVKIFEDFARTWFWILIGLVITMVISLLFIFLLRLMAGVLLWSVIFCLIGAVGYGIWHCYWEYRTLKGKPDADVSITDLGFHTDFRIYLQLSQTWLIFMIVLAVMEAVIILVLIFLGRRVCIAIALLKEGSRAISYVTSTLFYPIITFLLLAVCIAYWATTAVFLASSGEAVYKVISAQPDCKYSNMTCDPQTFSQGNVSSVCRGSQCVFAFYGGESVYHRYMAVLQLCNVFVLLWLVNFVLALGQCTLSGAFTSYYWTLNKPADIPACPVSASFRRTLRFHTGSLAFGSLILSTVQFIRIVLEYLDHKLKGVHNALARFLLCCLKCCFWCLEHVIRFMNRNAYIMIAIFGRNFCASARDAFFLLMRNVMRVAVLDKVTDFLLFLGKILISGSVGVLAFFFFTRQIPVFQEKVPSLNYYWVPLLTVVFGSYLVAHGFFSVYAMCVDTLFLCFLVDLEKNDGSASRPYYMSSSLRSILNNKNHGRTEERKRGGALRRK